MARSYYKRKVNGQLHRTLNRPVAGLDAYRLPSMIGDDNFSDCLDIEPYANDIVKASQHKQDVGNSLFDGSSGFKGRVIAQEMFTDYDGTEAIVLLAWDLTARKYYIRHMTMAGVLTSYDITSLSGWTATSTNATTTIFSSCLFSVEADTYVVFTNPSADKLVWFNGDETGSIALPFTPKRVTSHVNRVFITDDKNKIWWCRAGDIWTWYGLERDDDYIVTSVNMSNTALTIANQPDVTRPIEYTITTVDTADTLGTMAVVGTADDGTEQSETLTLQSGWHVSTKSYKTITSLTISGWSASGGADTIKVGIAAIGTGYVQDDQGYWTLERENSLADLCVIGNRLYIFAPTSIYVFSGYSPNTFSMAEMATDIGLNNVYDSNEKHLTVSNNVCYFIANNNAYEFNGYDMPRVISHQKIVNGSVANYVYSSIPEMNNSSVTTYWAIESDANRVYVYRRQTATSFGYSPYYIFDIKSRSWWFRQGFAYADTELGGADTLVNLLPTSSAESVYAIVHENTMAYEILVFEDQLGTNNGDYPYFVTKAFNTNPSEEGTLTGLVLSVKGTATKTGNIKFYFSKTESADDFTLIETKAVTYSGDLEQITVHLHPSLIARTHHYRIKVVFELPDETTWFQDVYVYALERMFRVQGRSR